MIDRTEERFGLSPERSAADTAYGSAATTLNWLVNDKKIAPHIPVSDRSCWIWEQGPECLRAGEP